MIYQCIIYTFDLQTLSEPFHYIPIHSNSNQSFGAPQFTVLDSLSFGLKIGCLSHVIKMILIEIFCSYLFRFLSTYFYSWLIIDKYMFKSDNSAHGY